MTPRRSGRAPRRRTRPAGYAAAVAGLLCAGLLGCGPEGPRRGGDPSLDARIRVSPTPATVGPAGVSVQASDRGARLVDARIRIRGLGPRGDTVGPVEATPSEAGHGPVSLTLPYPGRWEVEVELLTGDGREAWIRHPLQVVEAPGG